MLQTVITVLVVCISRVALADDQCIYYKFEPPFFTGISCEDTYNKNMGCHLSQNANFETFTKYRRYLLNINSMQTISIVVYN